MGVAGRRQVGRHPPAALAVGGTGRVAGDPAAPARRQPRPSRPNPTLAPLATHHHARHFRELCGGDLSVPRGATKGRRRGNKKICKCASTLTRLFEPRVRSYHRPQRPPQSPGKPGGAGWPRRGVVPMRRATLLPPLAAASNLKNSLHHTVSLLCANHTNVPRPRSLSSVVAPAPPPLPAPCAGGQAGSAPGHARPRRCPSTKKSRNRSSIGFGGPGANAASPSWVRVRLCRRMRGSPGQRWYHRSVVVFTAAPSTTRKLDVKLVE